MDSVITESADRKFCPRYKGWMVEQCAVCEACEEDENSEGESNE